ncbi:Chromatin modification-related protein EAF3 [Spathaspora sp. JA1]|nr:Chromatin modification-related protein EAF3 [Spathaspora sp. JA1]
MADFKPNQSVYAYHGPLIYEAKIIKVRQALDTHIINQDNQPETYANNPKFNVSKWEKLTAYLIHYQGWKSKWDEWVGIDRIMEFNEENKFKKQELDQLIKKRKSKTGTPEGTTSKSATTSVGPGEHTSKKLKPSSSTSSTSTSSTGNKKKKPNVTINLEFPRELKYLLVNDWEYITKDRKLVSLPSDHPVTNILQDYKTFRTKQLSSDQIRILVEILDGLEVYFNKSLSLILLYKYENLQYLNFLKSDLINQENSQSKVYGVEHLLRLLISFPGLIGQTTMDTISISVLISEIEELLKFLVPRLENYSNNYDYSSPQYDSLARA